VQPADSGTYISVARAPLVSIYVARAPLVSIYVARAPLVSIEAAGWKVDAAFSQLPDVCHLAHLATSCDTCCSHHLSQASSQQQISDCHQVWGFGVAVLRLPAPLLLASASSVSCCRTQFAVSACPAPTQLCMSPGSSCRCDALYICIQYVANTLLLAAGMSGGAACVCTWMTERVISMNGNTHTYIYYARVISTWWVCQFRQSMYRLVCFQCRHRSVVYIVAACQPVCLTWSDFPTGGGAPGHLSCHVLPCLP
jgi:hypothetical protein